MTFTPSYRSIVWTALVTGIFSVIVCAGMLVRYVGSRAVLPLDDARYLAMKQQLEADKQNSALRKELHDYDATLRATYFHQLRFFRRGALLLTAGVASSLLLIHQALTMRRRLPTLKRARQEGVDRQRQFGQVAAIACIAVVTSLTFGSKFANHDLLPDRGELAGVGDATNSEADPVGNAGVQPGSPVEGEEATATSPAQHELPTPEQLAANWPRFRGFDGSGITVHESLPITWDGGSGEGVLWKTPVELPGANSPIVWEKSVFLTGATSQRREVYCFDADTGALRWRRAVASQVSAELKVDESTGYAAPTAATDGQRVYAIFASGDLAAFDFQGNQLWSLALGPLDNPYGHGSSLATYEDRLIVQLDQGFGDEQKSRLVAIRGTTGDVIWEAQRTAPASWATPIVVQHEGQWRIITCGDPFVIAYRAEDGQEIWRADCLQGDVGPSPVYADGVVYVANDNAKVAAIRDGGLGDVTESHLIWSARYSLPDICSPLVTDQHLLLVASYGALVAYDRQRGGDEPLWEADLDNISFASPSLVGGRVYLIGDEGVGWVMRPGETGPEMLAENDLGEGCYASPAFQAGRIYLRGVDHLFCIGTPASSENGP